MIIDTDHRMTWTQRETTLSPYTEPTAVCKSLAVRVRHEKILGAKAGQDLVE